MRICMMSRYARTRSSSSPSVVSEVVEPRQRMAQVQDQVADHRSAPAGSLRTRYLALPSVL